MNLGGIRWGRGFFRLWAVLAGIWLIICSGFTINSLLNPYERSEQPIAFNKQSDSFELIDPWGEPYNTLEAAVRDGGAVVQRVGSNGRLYTGAKMSDTDRSGLIKEATAFYSAELERTRGHERIRVLLAWFWATIFWPLVLLAIGAAIGWALSGFRGKKA